MFPKNDGLYGLAERFVHAFERNSNKEAEEPSGGKAIKGGDYVPMTVEEVGTHLYFYCEVNTDRCLDLLRRIRQIDNSLREERASRMLPDDYPMVPIWLHIQSGGGELFTGFNVADQIQTIKTPIFSIVEGVCASAATLISMSCNKRYIMPSSFMLIHQLSQWNFGSKTYEQMKDNQHLIDMAMERLYGFYVARGKLDRVQVENLLKSDSWFDAEKSMELGLVDEILI